ncbi:hypothetical protein DUI70_3215 [Streptomyces albus]|nr:hypothetical protein DUI70_3215 [Streptomyces albus]
MNGSGPGSLAIGARRTPRRAVRRDLDRAGRAARRRRTRRPHTEDQEAPPLSADSVRTVVNGGAHRVR